MVQTLSGLISYFLLTIYCHEHMSLKIGMLNYGTLICQPTKDIWVMCAISATAA
jgi:hypothetical protein